MQEQPGHAGRLRESVPRVRDLGGAYLHKLPQTQGGFTPFGQGEMVPV